MAIPMPEAQIVGLGLIGSGVTGSLASALMSYYGSNAMKSTLGPKTSSKSTSSTMTPTNGAAEHRYAKDGYTSGARANNLFAKDKFTKKTEQLTEWRRSFDKADIANERRLFLGDDYVKVDGGKWRSLDGTRQFRAKPDDYMDKHGIGNL